MSDDLVRRALTALAEADASRRAPPYLERAVRDAFDRRQRHGVLRGTRPASWRPRYTAMGLAAAAAVTVMVYLQLQPADVSTPSIASRPLEVTGVPPVTPPPVAVAQQSAGRRFRPEPAVARVESTWTDNRDIVHTVSARVPRTMLPLLGVPVIDPDAPGTVKLEFLLDSDGQARTIRIRP